MKNSTRILLIILSVGLFTACSSPEEKAAAYIESGNALLEEGNLDKAALEYKNALQVNKNQPDAYYGLAQIHEGKQEWSKAFAMLNKIRELNPKHIDGRIKLAQLLLASNQLDQALLDAKEIRELAPDDGRAHALMAAVQYRLDDYDGAKVSINNALASDPNNQEALLVLARVFISQKDYEEAHEVLDKAIATNPENVSMYLMKIQAYGESENFEGVEAVYIALINQFPKATPYQLALARLYSSRKDIDKAEKILNDIIRNNPDSVDDKLRLIEFTRRNRSIDQSIAMLKDFIQQDSSEYRYQFLLGAIYRQNDQEAEAKSIYQKVIDVDGLQSDGLKARNLIALIEVSSGNRDNAVLLINEILAQDKNDENALLMQANFKLIDKLYDDAIIDLRTVLRDNPKSVKALSLVARAYEVKGSNQLALENYIKAYRLNPAIPLPANRLTEYYLRNRQIDKANEVLEESFAQGNQNLDSLKLFAQVKLSLQDWAAAEKIAALLQDVEGQEALSQQVLGAAYLGQEQRQESIDAFKKAHELAPSASQPVVSLVRTYVASGKIDEAKKFLNSILSVDDGNLVAYSLLGQISLSEKQPEKAKKYFLKTIEISPKQVAGYRSLAQIYLSAKKPGMAEKILKQGLVELPANPNLTMSLASIYEKQLAFDKAIDLYDDLLDKNPDILVAKNNLASLLSDHRTDAASMAKALEIAEALKDSPIPHFRDTYAWILIKSGQQLELAVVTLEGVVKEAEGNAIFHYHLGKAYEKKGDSGKATEQMDLVKKYSGPDTELSEQADLALQQISQ